METTSPPSAIRNLLRGLYLRLRAYLAVDEERDLARRLGPAALGEGARVDSSVIVRGGRWIRIGAGVVVEQASWLNAEPLPGEAPGSGEGQVKLTIGEDAFVGMRCILSAARSIIIEPRVLMAPGVFISDHNHRYDAAGTPVMDQGIGRVGSVRIGRGAWLGVNSVILGTHELTIGEGAVVGAGSVVLDDVPPFSVVAGNPARLIRRWLRETGAWERVDPGGGGGNDSGTGKA